ncbi:MAG: N-acetyltransferase family protein [Solirubrobacterales bacterium]
MIGRFRRYARENGIRAALARTAAELRRRAFSANRITILLKDLDDVKVPRRPSELEVVPLEKAHLAGLSELNRRRGRPGVDRRFEADLERGLHGFVALLGGEVVGYYWWVEGERFGQHPDARWLGDSFQIEPGDVYGSDNYLLPEARGGGTAGQFLYRIESSIAALGYRRIWGYVESGNREARWLYSSRGYQPMRDVSVRTVFSRRLEATPVPTPVQTSPVPK